MKDVANQIDGVIGVCGSYQVFLGFAPAKVLHSVSFADVLDEDTGRGYQRPRNVEHSADFKRYISTPNSSTIPLTFNLRQDLRAFWRIRRFAGNRAILTLQDGKRCMAQVDCQHRLGELANSNITFAFMSFIGLDLRSEMSMFVVINSKAKGLSSSLTDYHQSNLMSNLVEEAPHLYIATRLNEDAQSPWFKMIKLGGQSTSGLRRRTSLRMMQKAVSRFLKQVKPLNLNPEATYEMVADYWQAVSKVFHVEWQDHRHHLLTKGIGLYSLMQLLSDFVLQANGKGCNTAYFEKNLQSLRRHIDWKSTGMFAAAGGQKGALGVYMKLRKEIPNASLVG